MMLVRSYALVLFLIALSACTIAPTVPSDGDLIASAEALAAQQKFGQALAVLANVTLAHPQYARIAAKRREIAQEAVAFETDVVNEAHALVSSGEWSAAGQVYVTALATYPQSDALQSAYARFKTQRDKRVTNLQRNLVLREGEWLAHDIPLREELIRAAEPERAQEQLIASKRERAGQLAAQLHVIGLEAMNERDFELAERSLSVADELKPSPEIQRALASLGRMQAQLDEQARAGRMREKAYLEEKRKAVLSRRVEERRQRTQAILSEYNEAYKRGDLLEAKRLTEELSLLESYHPELPKLQEQVQTAIDVHVKKGLDQGRQLYARGRIEEAIKEWQGLLRYDPDNAELKDNIARAQRVLDKLQQLSEDLPAGPAPAKGAVTRD
jgi:tetratricopeptide (TPR) repeat protein